MVLAMGVDASLITSTSFRHASGMAAVKLPFGLKGRNLIRLPDPFLVFTLHQSLQGASKPSNLQIHCSNVGGASHVNNGESDFRKKQDSSFQFNLFSSAPGPISHQDMKLNNLDGANNRENDVDPRRIFRTTGSRSIPSRSSIPGRYSKYSDKVKGRGGPMKSRSLVTLPVPSQLQTPLVPPPSIELLKESVSRAFTTSTPSTDDTNVSTASANANENAVADASYSHVDLRRRKVCYPPAPPPPPSLIPPELPFEFQYSYTEVPKVAPLGYREPQFSPFGPEGVERPWTGRPPQPKSKKPVRGVDSFKPPPPGKKGVKTVCQPGPFPEGQGPRYVRTREEILGDPLTPEEVKSLVESVYKEKRQINLGRDGLTHNMLNDVHNHWRRRRVVKVKCKGVPTVDMDNVCFHLEDKTGGKIIHRSGGVVVLFRGRNYNTRLRPQFPLMLWKPAAPIYPRLIQATPGGLTWEEAMEMRKRGSKVKALTKLGKNGVYLNLVRHVREAFEVDELIRIDCTGLNPSDYKKIGAKLRDLVPCVLLSFEREQILIWRGHDWKSSSATVIDEKNTLPSEHLSTVEEDAALYAGSDSEDEQSEEGLDTIERLADYDSDDGQSIKSVEVETRIENEVSCQEQVSNERIGQAPVDVPPQDDELEALWQQAATSGLLVSLDDNSLDADSVHKKVSLLVVGESVQTTNAEDVVKSHETGSLAGAVEDQDKNSKASLTAGEEKKANGTSKRDSSLPSMRELSALDVQPQEGLPVDELAKLLSM